MKNKNTPPFSMNFWLNKQRSKSSKAAVYLRLTIANRRVEIATQQYINPTHWDPEMEIHCWTTREAEGINAKLIIVKTEVKKHYDRLTALGKLVTAEMVKNEYLGIGVTEKTMNELLSFYIIRFKEKVAFGKKAKNTLKCICTTNKKIKEFMKFQYKVSDMLVRDIKISFVSNFEHFLTTKHGLSSNSAMKYIRILKRIIKFAADQDWISHNPVAQFKCSYLEPERDRLTMEEILILYNKDFGTERLAQVRDVFLFCCFTGFSYLDVYKLTRENIVNGIDGRKWIMKDREKTKSAQRVPLLPIAMEIIERYKDDYYCQVKSCLLPVNTNQCYNAYLKEIATICEIEKHMTTHVARHTFATAVTLENDVPIETVSQMLGHKSIKTTQIYAKVTQRKMSNNMKALEEKLHQMVPTLQQRK